MVIKLKKGNVNFSHHRTRSIPISAISMFFMKKNDFFSQRLPWFNQPYLICVIRVCIRVFLNIIVFSSLTNYRLHRFVLVVKSPCVRKFDFHFEGNLSIVCFFNSRSHRCGPAASFVVAIRICFANVNKSLLEVGTFAISKSIITHRWVDIRTV